MVEIRGKNVHCTCSKLLLEVGDSFVPADITP